MDNSERVRHLTSTRLEELLDALRELAVDTETPPSDEVVEAGLALMKHPDAEVRHETIWALCLHWGHMRTLPMLRAMLEGQEKDLEVLLIAARSMGSMVARSGLPDERSLGVLARVALDESADPQLRGVAYTGLRAAAGLPPPRGPVQLEEDIRQLGVDWEWLRAMASGRNS